MRRSLLWVILVNGKVLDVDDVESAISDEFTMLISDYLASDNEEVVNSLLILRNNIFERLGLD